MRRTAILYTAVAAFVAGAAAPLPKPLSHLAQYDVVRGSGAVNGATGISGRLVLKFQESCGGYATTQRLMADITDSDSNVSRMDFILSSWESVDGKTMRFDLDNSIDGQDVGSYEGDAAVPSGAGAGRASFVKPRPVSLDLPAGTIFPTEFSQRLVAAARDGVSQYAARVFSGDSDEEVYEAVAFIGRMESLLSADIQISTALAGVPSWPVAVSYYGRDSIDGRAAYDMSFRLYENGVMTNINLVFPDFALRARLVELDSMPASCDR